MTRRTTSRTRGHARAGRRWLAVVALCAASLTGAPSAQSQAACRITSADAFLYSERVTGDVVTYYAQTIMYTEHCGLSPAEVQSTFTPVTGSASTCDFRGTLFSEYALCKGAAGFAAPGTPVVVDTVGRTYGSGGADLFASSCVLVVMPIPPSDLGSSAIRGSCPLPLE